MNEIEILIVIVLLAMSIPDVCRRLGRPALVYPVYLVAGMAIAPILMPSSHILLAHVGKLGLLILLFQIGLEVDVPHKGELAWAARRALPWFLIAAPLAAAVAYLGGTTAAEALLCGAALSACSVSIAFPAWRTFPGLEGEPARRLLLWMVAVEVMAIVVLSAGDGMLRHGFGIDLAIRLGGLFVAVVLTAVLAERLGRVLHRLIAAAAHWRVHFIVLAILVIGAVGERLGLAAPKTAFFLGLFMSRATHEGLQLKDHLAPLGDRFLVPLFFLSLGATLPLATVSGPQLLLGAGAAVALLLGRWLTYRQLASDTGSWRTFLLMCPNLTVTAVAATVLHGAGASAAAVQWLMLVSLCMTTLVVLLLPASARAAQPAPTSVAASA